VKLELGFIDNTLGMRDSARILLSSKGLTMLGFNDVLAWGLDNDRFANDWIHDVHWRRCQRWLEKAVKVTKKVEREIRERREDV